MGPMRRNRLQTALIYVRIAVALSMSVLPFYDLFSMIRDNIQIWPVNVLINGGQILSWMIHLGAYVARLFPLAKSSF